MYIKMTITQLRGRVFTHGLLEKATCFVAVLSIVLSITCIICLLEIVHRPKSQNGQTHSLERDPPGNQQACLTTTLGLSLSDPSLRKLSVVKEGNKTLFCAKTTEGIIAALLHLVLSHPKKQKEPLPTFDPTNFTLSKYSVQKQWLQSNIRDPVVEHVRGVDVNANNMVIKVPGYYYVYSYIIFKPDSALPCKGDEALSWDHNIVLTRDSDRFASGVILRSTHSCCGNCHNEIASSFTGGVLYLQEFDKLHVEVPGHGLVGYFGLYMLGEKEQG